MSINETTGGDGSEKADVNEAEDEESRKRLACLYEAAANGKWGKAEEILKKCPEYVRHNISNGNTALHVAVIHGQIDFAERLVNQYRKEVDLKQENKDNHTAFSLAAVSGNTKLAELMFVKNNELAMIRRKEKLPIQTAAKFGHEKMVKYLYQSTKDKLKNEDLIELLVQLIHNDLYDAALMMVKGENKEGELAILTVEGETALHALAGRPPISNAERGGLLSRSMMENKKMCPNALKLVQLLWKIIPKLNYDEKMHPKALELVRLLWKPIAQWDYDQIARLIAKPWSLIHIAAQNGNIEFLSVLIETHPDLICGLDKNGYSIFHTAVEYRHESIFELVYKTPSIKSVIVAGKVGSEKNNILHLAAKLPPQNRLNIVSGAALQMQRELWWFEEVRQLMPPSFAEAENKKGKTARALFTESHKNLKRQGEEWMKKTAESCMIVATLITTIVFAAAFTLPGGNKGDTGAPNFVKKASFIVFAASDTISLVSSACSILSFLAILTARYAEEDFRWSLPLKLLLGLFSLFISIIGMMVVFCTTLFIVFDEGTIGPFILAISLALIPIIMFVFQQIGLLIDVVKSMRLFNYHFQKTKEEKQSKEEEQSKGRTNYNFLKRQSGSLLFQGRRAQGKKPIEGVVSVILLYNLLVMGLHFLIKQNL